MSCELGEMRRRRHLPAPATAPPLDDDDLLAEILLRLPPQTSSLPRASAVCKRWRGLASDSGFSRRFRRHHRRNPPLLGCFMRDGNEIHFEPTLDPPNRVPEGRFSFPVDDGEHHFMFLGCRHGFLLMLHTFQGTLELLVWDPVSGHSRSPGIRCEETDGKWSGASHCHWSWRHTKLQGGLGEHQRRTAARDSPCLLVGDRPNVSSFSPAVIDPIVPFVLVGNSLYVTFLGKSSSIIEFDVGRQGLEVIPLPAGLDPQFNPYFSFMRAEGGGLGLLSVSKSGCSAQLWKRKTDCDGVYSWVLGRTIDLDKLISLHLENCRGLQILGFAEENNVVFLRVYGSVGVFMIQLDSLQLKKLPEINLLRWHPFESVYAAGI